MVCVKNKRGPKGSRERNIHRVNATKAILQTSGAVKHFFPTNLEGGSESTKNTNIQSEYIGDLDKIKETHIMAYYMRYPFVIPKLVDEYSGAVEDRWGNCEATGVYLLSH